MIVSSKIARYQYQKIMISILDPIHSYRNLNTISDLKSNMPKFTVRTDLQTNPNCRIAGP